MTSSGEPLAWSRRLLRAAYWVTRVLGAGGRATVIARGAWISLPLAGEVDLSELEIAEAGLLRSGLLICDGDTMRPSPRLAALCLGPGPVPYELLLGVLLEAEQPLWLLAAGREGDRLSRELIPDEIESALAGVIADPARREAFLLARGRTVNAAELAEIGEGGELAVVQACQEQLIELGANDQAAAVRRVSQASDELGFDVLAPRADGSPRRLEVKTTRSSASQVSLFLSRNELETGSADPDWRLIVVRVDRKGGHVILGHIGGGNLYAVMPEDKDPRARWVVMRLKLRVDQLVPGLPAAGSLRRSRS